MRLTRPRLTLRRLRIAGAVVAVVLGGTLFLSVYYARKSAGYRHRELEAKNQIKAEYFRAMAAKYRRAIDYPWFPVPPDPPEPK